MAPRSGLLPAGLESERLKSVPSRGEFLFALSAVTLAGRHVGAAHSDPPGEDLGPLDEE